MTLIQSRTKVKIRSASNTYAVGSYKDIYWTAKRIDGSWKLKTKAELTPGAKANIAHQINKFLETGEDV
jgi:hypothetical protein